MKNIYRRAFAICGALTMVFGMSACGASAKVIENEYNADAAPVGAAETDDFDAIAFDRELRAEMLKLDRTPFDMSQLTFLANEDGHGASETASAGYSEDADAVSSDATEEIVTVADASGEADTQTTAATDTTGYTGEVRSIEQLIEAGRNGETTGVMDQFAGRDIVSPAEIDMAQEAYFSANPNRAAELHELAEADDLTYEERLAAMKALGL